jgi:hypothetical protein
MTNKEFNEIVDNRCQQIKNILAKKAEEYASNECRLHNFKVGGRLVSIMSNAVTFNSNKKFEYFRNFVDEHGEFYKVEPESFKDAFNSTGVSVVICVLDKEI